MNNDLIWTPSIEVESANGTRQVALLTRHLMNRKIFIQGTITPASTDDFLSEFLYLKDQSEDPVTIFINSPGGEVTAGLAIYDMIQNSDIEINMVCVGLAASMAAILLAGGQKNRRFLTEHSKVMIHEPLISGGVGGSATSIKNISDSILETRQIVNEILSKHTGKAVEEIDTATAYDHYMNSKEALEFGICDKVISDVVNLK